ncbi:squamosa promoter-binding-like protein 12 isoform X1 [Canna indica]|uniref:Squamosa promoter-binding-like protein 12 isoform X1 n=1 Tax=Canna indica TaxID=4628 RepID=A0AAQ3JLV8_9LILI|nr:squamosa promoter-binding-like protein 12 isoform X1 [Canna indica]
MDWTSKTSLQWDWETLFPFSGKEAEISKFVQQPEWKFDGCHGNSYANYSGSSYSFGGGACSGSELGYGSSRSSISVSIGSSSKAGTKTSECNVKSAEQSPESLRNNKDLTRLESGILHRLEVSDSPKEPLIGLKLGKRTYFEDVCGENNITNLSSLASLPPTTGLVKKAKLSQQKMQNSCCQVEGCNVDLTSVKDYHRKHRVCESHSKSPRVIVAGQERRFCQQCSRFHDLSEFDHKKRSCRRRLSDHNARRRKPQPETMSFSSSIFSSPYYGVREPTNIIFGQAPFAQVTNMDNSTLDGNDGFKLIPTRGSWVNSSKLGVRNGHLHLPCIGMPKSISTLRHNLDGLSAFKGTTTNVLDKGHGATAVASYSDGASDLRRALSLLSTESLVPCNLESVSDIQFVNANIIPSHSANHPTKAATGIWQQDELSFPLNLQSNAGQLQEFQLKRTPSDPFLTPLTYTDVI